MKWCHLLYPHWFGHLISRYVLKHRPQHRKNRFLHKCTTPLSSTGAWTTDIFELWKCVVPILLENWLECSPTEQSISSDKAPKTLHTMQLIISMINLLLQHMEHTDPLRTSNSLAPFVKDFHKFIFVHFPFQYMGHDSKHMEILHSLHVDICTTMCYFICNTTGELRWNESVVEFVGEALEGKETSKYIKEDFVLKLHPLIPRLSQQQQTELLQVPLSPLCADSFEGYLDIPQT